MQNKKTAPIMKTKDSSRLPVSKKAYRDFTDRLATAFRDSDDSRHLTAEALSTLNSYLDGDTEASGKASPVVRIVFAVIRPEIDRAIERSRRARSRRKPMAATAATTATAVENPVMDVHAVTDETATDGNPAPRPVNRRERRLREQAVRREKRRFARTLMRWKKEFRQDHADTATNGGVSSTCAPSTCLPMLP